MTTTLEILNAANVQFWRNLPLYINWQTSAQSIATSGTITALTWPSPSTSGQADTYSGWSSGNPTRYTGKVAGYYEVTASYAAAANATGDRDILLVKNGTTASPFAQTSLPAATASDATCLQASNFVFLNGSTDYVEVYVVQRSGGALNTVINLTTVNIIMVHS